MTSETTSAAMQFVPLLLTAVILLAMVLPIARILRRAGYRRIWCIIVIVPLVNLVALWVFAYARWPTLDKPSV